MKNTLLIVLTSILLFSCGQRLGDYYFDFDQVDHFAIQIDEMELYPTMDELDEFNAIPKLKRDLIINDLPKSITDTSFISKLEKFGFKKEIITGEKIKSIRELFREKSNGSDEATACSPVYRDILIFRKESKIVGIAKICFDCSQHQILGTVSETHNFGQGGDYGKLESLLTRK